MKTMGNIEIWYSENELRQFIDLAFRCRIRTIYGSRTEDQPYSLFTYCVVNSKENYDKFCSQLNYKLTRNVHWRAIEIDLKGRFFLMLNQYLQWYSDNKQEFEKFKPNCPYTLMLSIIESTKAEIIKYFPQTIKNTDVNSQFSALEWATIFYYADQTKLLPEDRKIKDRMNKFMEKHNVSTTFQNFRVKYYDANKRINIKNDYPIDKLDLIIPFLEKNYQQTVTKVENDKVFLNREKSEY